MTRISPAEAFSILGKWRDNKSQLHINLMSPGAQAGIHLSGSFGAQVLGDAGGRGWGRILACSLAEERISLSLDSGGQDTIRDLALRGASFECGQPAHSEFFPESAEAVRCSYLFAKLANGSWVLLLEPLA